MDSCCCRVRLRVSRYVTSGVSCVYVDTLYLIVGSYVGADVDDGAVSAPVRRAVDVAEGGQALRLAPLGEQGTGRRIQLPDARLCVAVRTAGDPDGAVRVIHVRRGRDDVHVGRIEQIG